jgi:hypothetical protein
MGTPPPAFIKSLGEAMQNKGISGAYIRNRKFEGEINTFRQFIPEIHPGIG